MELLAQAESTHEPSLENWGYWVLAGYLLTLLLLGIWGWRRSTSGEEDYYLAGRRQGWMISSLTIMATFFSSFALLGAPGMVYREGVVFALFSLNVPVGGLTVYLLGSRIWKLGRRFGYVTPGDMVCDYYQSRGALRILVALTGFLYAIPYIVMQIQAGGIISEKLFGQGSFTTGAIVLAAITMVYIMIGGMRSVSWTDVLQGVLLMSGMLVAGLAMFLIFHGPAQFGARVMSDLPASSLTAPGNTGEWSWSRTMTLCILASTGSMVQPAQWMRYYSAASLQALRRSAVIFSLLLTSCFLLGVMLIGLAGQVLYPLQFSVSVPVRDGPARLAAMDEDLERRFEYLPPDSDQPGRVVWKWQGKQLARLTEDELGRLRQLSDDENYRAALQTMSQRVAELKDHRASSTERPQVRPHPAVNQSRFDDILVVVLDHQLPRVLGRFGAVFASLMLVAIMAASMSTADSNLHALSAVVTRDIYDQFIDPAASERERLVVGRLTIVAATVLSLAIVIGGRHPQIVSRYDILTMIAKMGFLAIAFSAQLLPMAIDMLFLRRGTSLGACLGLAAGLAGVCLFGPPLQMLIDALGQPAWMLETARHINHVKALVNVDPSFWGLLLNAPIFAGVSLVTRALPMRHREKFRIAVNR